MRVDQPLVDAAKSLLVQRYGDAGWGGASAMYTASGRILTSVYVEALCESAGLCFETGAIAEAHKLNEPIVAAASVVRDEGSQQSRVLPSCGICLERLRFWGPDVEVAVPDHGAAGGWRAYRLAELQPLWWGEAYGA